jgi:hypothetical protein
MKRLRQKGIIEAIFGNGRKWNVTDGWSDSWSPAPTSR